MIKPMINSSIIKRAIEQKAVSFKIINFREFSTNKHQTVDDTPYGGGAGMVLSVEPIYYALKSIDDYEDAHVILLSPQGKTYDQDKAKSLLIHEHIIFVCGHYEGFDDRIRDLIDEEISIGDYVLTGGELPAMVVIDSITRLLPNVLGNKESINEESHSRKGILEYPQYTRPEVFKAGEKEYKVPDVLLSGDHKKIKKWRQKNSQKK